MLPQIIGLVNGKHGFEPRLPKSRAIALNPMLVGFVLFCFGLNYVTTPFIYLKSFSFTRYLHLPHTKQ